MLIESKGHCLLLGTILRGRIRVDTMIDGAHGPPL